MHVANDNNVRIFKCIVRTSNKKLYFITSKTMAINFYRTLNAHISWHRARSRSLILCLYFIQVDWFVVGLLLTLEQIQTLK